MSKTMQVKPYKIPDDVSLYLFQDKSENYNREKFSFEDLFDDKLLLTRTIKSGVSYGFFERVLHFTPFSETEWADFLDLSTKSLQRYKQANKAFGPLQSEKIIEIAEVTQLGLEVFGNMGTFKLWLDTPNYALGNLKPHDLLSDSYGKELLIAELTRIHHGIFV